MDNEIAWKARGNIISAWIIMGWVAFGLLIALPVPDWPLGSIPILDPMVGYLRLGIPSIGALHEVSDFPNKTARVLSVYWVFVPVQVLVFWRFRHVWARRNGLRGRRLITTLVGVATITLGSVWMMMVRFGQNSHEHGTLASIERLISALPVALGFVGQLVFIAFSVAISITLVLGSYLVGGDGE